MELRNMLDVRTDCMTYPEMVTEYLRHFPYYYPCSLLDSNGVELSPHRKSMVDFANEAVAVAEWLQSEGLKKGDRVLLVFLPSVELLITFFGCMMCGVVPLPTAPPLRLDSDLPTFSALVKAVGATHCLSHTEYHNLSMMLTARTRVSSFFSIRKTPSWPDIKWLYIDSTISNARKNKLDRKTLQEKADAYSSKVTADDIAYLQLTSGSTGNPKAVVISHDAAMMNSFLNLTNPVYREPGQSADVTTSNYSQHFKDQLSRVSLLSQSPHDPLSAENAYTVTAWVPYYHDFFLAHVNNAFIYGATLLILSPMDFLKKPCVWIQAMDRYNTTLTGCPNFALEYICSHSSPSDLAKVKRCPEYFMLGGEPTRMHTVHKFCSLTPAYTVQNFVNAYGIAEGVSGVCVGRLIKSHVLSFDKVGLEIEGVAHPVTPGTPGAIELIAAGNAHEALDRHGHYLLIAVDYETEEELPEGRVGEIWVHSRSMGLGYWGWTKEENDKVFNGVPSKRILAKEGMTFLRTGDRGFVLNDRLFLIGRYKQTLIIRGHNYEPSDIEYIIGSCHSSIRAGGVIVLSVPNEETGTDEMVMIIEVRNPSQITKDEYEAIAHVIRESLSVNFTLQCPLIHFAEAKKAVKKTSSGKPKRYLVYERYMKGEIPFLYESRREFANEVDRSENGASQSESSSSASSSLVSANPSGSQEISKDVSSLDIGQLKSFIVKRLNLPEDTSCDDPLTALGLDSVVAVEVANMINDKVGKNVINAEYIGSGVTMTDVVDYVNQAIVNGDINDEREKGVILPTSLKIESDLKNVRITSVSLSLPNCCSFSQFWSHLVNADPFYQFYNLMEVTEKECLIDNQVCALQPHIEKAFMKLKSDVTMPFGFLDNSLKDANNSSLSLICISSIEDALQRCGLSMKDLPKSVTIHFVSPTDLNNEFMKPNRDETAQGISNHFEIPSNQMFIVHEGHCGSGLFALQQASRSIASSAEVAIIVGLNVISTRASAISGKNAFTNSTPKPFGVNRSGYVRAEGVVTLLLTSDDFAAKHSLPILGKLKGVTAKNYTEEVNVHFEKTGNRVSAQSLAMRDALEMSGVSANDISYVSLHGAGTLSGDVEEYSAVCDVYGKKEEMEGKERESDLYVGTVSAVVGNTEVLSGLLETVKVLYVLVSKTVPGMIGEKGKERGKEGESEFVFDKECDLSSIGNVKVPLQTVNVDFLTERKNPSDSHTVLFGSINGYGIEGFSANAIVEVDNEVQSGWETFLTTRGGRDGWISCSDALYVPTPSLEEIQKLSYSSLSAVEPFSLSIGNISIVWKEPVDLRYVGDLAQFVSISPQNEESVIPNILVTQSQGIGLNKRACVSVEVEWSGETEEIEREIKESGWEMNGVCQVKEKNLVSFSYNVEFFKSEEEGEEEEGEEEED